MLYAKEITYSYGRRLAPVLCGLNLHLAPGHIYGLLGSNGTGKSTLLYLLCGLLRPQSGRVSFGGVDVIRRCPDVLSEMFLVPEEFELPNMSLGAYVRLNAPFYPRFDHETLRACLVDFELSEACSLTALSMGQRKKALMSFALATGVRLLLMDEPTNGLDIPSKSLFRRVVARHLTDDRTLLVSTHQVADVSMLIDHVLMIEGGRLLLDRSVSDICRAVRFEQRGMNEPADGELYSQPSMAGRAVIVPNGTPDDDTPVDLEVLFNAARARCLPRSLFELPDA